jgi:hypothetical protein
MPIGPGVSSLSYFSARGGGGTESGQCFYISGSYSVCRPSFRLGGGRPLHNVLTFIFRTLMEVPTVCFAYCLEVLLSVLLLPRCNRFLGPGSLCYCCILGPSVVSYRPSVLQELLLQNRPWSAFSLGSGIPRLRTVYKFNYIYCEKINSTYKHTSKNALCS